MGDGSAIVSAIVLCGPTRPAVEIRAQLPAGAVVIAADGAFAHAAPLGLTVDHLVGDFDSIAPHDLAAARSVGVTLRQSPRDKDDTDLELALQLACDLGARDIIVVDGGLGDRPEHFVANVAVLASRRWLPARVRGVIANASVVAMHPDLAPLTVRGSIGDLVSIVTVGAPAIFERSAGLRWPLAAVELAADVGLGLSNELIATTATISLRSGAALLFRSEESA